MLRVTSIAMAALIVHASPASADEIKPEMIVTFSKGALACLESDHLQEITEHAIKGEATKAQAMMVDNGGDCLMIPPSQRLKVLSAEYNDPEMGFGILEIVGEDKVSLNGAWTYSIGAEEVKTKVRKHKK